MMRRSVLVFMAVYAVTMVLLPLGNNRTSIYCQTGQEGYAAMSVAAGDTLFQFLPGSGKKCWINDTTYFTYKFAKKPKLGAAFLKVQVFAKNGQKVRDLTITGRSDMPSMRGAHDSGEVAFKQNKRGDYLLPVNVVMPGDWEVRLTFKNGQKIVYRGRFTFDV